MADYYDTLSNAAQADVRSRLWYAIQAHDCPEVDTSPIHSAEDLIDPANRGLAVDCFQHANPGVGTYAGVLDQKTYVALVGWWTAQPMLEKMLIGGGVLAVAWMWLKKRRRRRRS
jgi:hypothetical protein